MGQVISTVPSEGVEATEARFYLSSLPPEAKCLAAAVRGHWGIEQSLHRALDVSFNEDRSRNRKGHGPVNFAPLRRMAVNWLKWPCANRATSQNQSLRLYK